MSTLYSFASWTAATHRLPRLVIKLIFIYIQVMYIYILIVMIWLGLLGNVMSFIVFALQRRQKAQKMTPNTVGLLMCLAAADSLFLISNIFSRVLPTISKYIYLGEKLKWSLLIRSYSTIWASIFQGFATFLVFVVTLHIYFIVTHPAKAKMCTSRTKFLVPGILLFSISYNIPRFFELTVVFTM